MPEQLPEIQGKIPDSKEEVWVANALYELGIPFVFQWSIAGGMHVRMGRIIDFLLYPQQPNEQPLEVYGNYWHENELPGGDLIRVKQIEQHFGKELLIMWADDIVDQTTAKRWLKQEVLI